MESVEVTVQPIGGNTCSPIDLLPYVIKLRVGSDIIYNTAIHEKYPHLSINKCGSFLKFGIILQIFKLLVYLIYLLTRLEN